MVLRWVKRCFWFILGLLLFVFMICFLAENKNPVVVVFIGKSLPPLSLSLWIVVSFVFGGFLSGSLGVLLSAKHKIMQRKWKKEKEKMNVEMKILREKSFKSLG